MMLAGWLLVLLVWTAVLVVEVVRGWLRGKRNEEELGELEGQIDKLNDISIRKARAVDELDKLHPNCRCVLVPIKWETEPISDLVIDALAEGKPVAEKIIAYYRIRHARRRELAGPLLEYTIEELIRSSQDG